MKPKINLIGHLRERESDRHTNKGIFELPYYEKDALSLFFQNKI